MLQHRNIKLMMVCECTSGLSLLRNILSSVFGKALLCVYIIGFMAGSARATDSVSTLYVPLIGITSVPTPMVIQKGPASVTYNYAVKNFLKEVPLTDIKVVDDRCLNIEFVEGDDNYDSKLDYSETWRYRCSSKVSATTTSIATVSGTAKNLITTQKAYATIVVGSRNKYPLISLINITKIAYPLTLPKDGGEIVFTYKVNNPGDVPLSNIVITDDKCSSFSNRLGDTNGNELLDPNEVWIYTCKMMLRETTTNTTKVIAFGNGRETLAESTTTVSVAIDSENYMDSIFVWIFLLSLFVIVAVFIKHYRKGRNDRT